MSRELVGNNGAIVGTDSYFRKLNEDYDLSDIWDIPEGYKYYDGLRALSSNIASVLSSVYNELRSNAKNLPYLPENDRKETAEIAKGLGEICNNWGSSCSDAGRIADLVLLSSYEARTKSGANNSEIEKAAQKIGSSSYGLSNSEKVRLIEKSIGSSIERVSEGDSQKYEFLLEVEKGRGDRFLEDVLICYEYLDRSSSYTQICNSQYNQSIVKEAFRRDFPQSFSYGSGKKYVSTIKGILQSISNSIERDLESGISNKDYIIDENGKRLKGAIQQLDRVGVSCYGIESKVDKLIWFVGGDSGKILQLQRNLNSLG